MGWDGVKLHWIHRLVKQVVVEIEIQTVSFKDKLFVKGNFVKGNLIHCSFSYKGATCD